jgi:serine/threonine-protein kinase
MSSYVGTVVVNYRLAEKLGEGGFGVVYLAEHEVLGRKAAVKILHPEFARRQELVDRFFREARAVCAINHKAIIDVQNFGSLPSGEPYYVMEYFPGQTLAEWIDERGPMPPARLAAVFEPVARALAAAHATGVIHRDLKPENIMIAEGTAGLEVKLLDFGIAKLMDPSASSGHSRTGFTMGTPAYMAPEQSRDAKNVDQRADVYSFGATLYFALAGRPPFVADNLTDLIVAVATTAPEPLRAHARGISPGLDAAVATCLSKSPDGRFESIDAAWSAIEQGARAAPATTGPQPAQLPAAIAATMPQTPPPPAPHPVTTLGAAAGQRTGPGPAASRSRAPLIAGVAFGLIAAAGAITYLAISPGSDSAASAGADAAASDAQVVAALDIDAAPAIPDAAPPIDAAPPPIDAAAKKRVEKKKAAPPKARTGDKTAERPAASEVRPGRTAVAGELPKAAIRQAIKRVRGLVKACGSRHPIIVTTRVTAQIRIGGDGKVINVSTSGGPAPLASCVARALRSARFPAPRNGGVVNVRFPFVFTAPGAAAGE